MGQQLTDDLIWPLRQKQLTYVK